MANKISHQEFEFGVGDVVRVHQLVSEPSKGEDKTRTQIFEGTVIGIRGRGMGKSFVVRRIGAQNVGIEQIIPLHSPLLKKIELARAGLRGSKQAKLYYIRDKSRREIETIYKRNVRRVNAKSQKEEPKKTVKKSDKKIASKKTAKKPSKKK